MGLAGLKIVFKLLQQLSLLCYLHQVNRYYQSLNHLVVLLGRGRGGEWARFSTFASLILAT